MMQALAEEPGSPGPAHATMPIVAVGYQPR
jgi:hypothetical protein